MKKFGLMLISMLLLCTSVAWSQTRTITGRVIDDKGNAIPFASISVKGSLTGTAADEKGVFTIAVGVGGEIEVSANGYSTKTVTPVDQDNVITLMTGGGIIDEVVVTGYGMRKSVRENISSISKIDGSAIAKTPLPSFDQALAGKTAGVQITAAGGLLGDGMAIRVRGINSISTSSQPLIVIDGIPQVTGTNLNSFNSGDGTRFNPLAMLNTNDIESIEVLKDAGAASIYGSRAANGVILITTKKGSAGSANVTVESRLGFGRATQLPDMLNGDQFTSIMNEKAGHTAARPGIANPTPIVAKDSDIDGDGVPDRTDWISLLYRQAKTQEYIVTASGGSEKAQFYGSAKYSDLEGISINNRLRTGQFRLNGDVRPNKWFKLGFGSAYSKSLNNGVLSNFYTAGSTIAWQTPPNVSAYNPNGPLGYNITTTAPIGILGWGNNVRSATTGNFTFFHPLNSNWNVNNNTAEDLRGNIYAEVQPISGLKFTTKFGIQYLTNYEHQYTPPFQAGLGNPYNGLVQDNTAVNTLWDWQNILSYDKTIAGSHRIGVVVGSEYQRNDFRETYTGAANFSDPFFQYIIDGAYTNTQPGSTSILNLTGGDLFASGIESYLGRLSYSFKSKYFVEGAIRRDSYSGFGINSKWGTFPSVSLGWDLSKEAFLSSLSDIVTLAKLRGSYGKVGNSAGVGAYSSRVLYGGAAYTSLTGLGNTQAGNSALQWESSNKFDIGLDLGFFDERLGVTIDYFKNDINQLILEAPIPYTVGVPSPVLGTTSITSNIGGMYNKGIEFTINAVPVISGDFQWRTSFNYTHIKNKITGLVATNNNADITSSNSVASVGKSLGEFFLPVWAGVDATTGNPQWYAKDGTIKRYNFEDQKWTNDKGEAAAALSTSDYVYTGKVGLPTWYGGWDNTVSYKGLSLNISLFYQGGNYLYNGTRAVLLSNNGFVNNSTEVLNRWQKPGDNTDIAKLYLLDNTANSASTRFLEKADFLRVRTIVLSYALPNNLLKGIGFKGVSFDITALNPFTITGYSGIDPEVNTNRFSNIAVGYDTRSIPQTRSILFGIRASL